MGDTWAGRAVCTECLGSTWTHQESLMENNKVSRIPGPGLRDSQDHDLLLLLTDSIAASSTLLNLRARGDVSCYILDTVVSMSTELLKKRKKTAKRRRPPRSGIDVQWYQQSQVVWRF